MGPKAETHGWRLAVVLFLALASFPGEVFVPSSGLDPSWMWALNVLPHQGVVFGRDTTFTYGPLGFLVVPQDVHANVWFALLFRLALQALFAGSLLVLLRDTSRWRAGVAMGLLMLSALVLYPELDAHVFMVLAAAALAIDRSRHPVLAAAAAALVPVLVLMKTTYGYMAVVLLGPVFAMWLFERRRDAFAPIALAAASFVLVLGALVAVCFGSVSNFFTWLDVAREFVAGYTDAMGQPGPVTDVVAAVALIALVGAYFAVRVRDQRRFAVFALVLALAVFIVFKRGFVRQGHSLSFFSSVCGLMAILLMQEQERRTWTLGLVAAAATWLSGAVFQARDGLLTPPSLLEGVTGARGAKALRAWMPPRPKLPGTYVADVLSPEWVDIIRAEGDGVVGVLPLELTIAPANGLTLRPNAVLQAYATYTRRLDQLEGEHFASERAPKFLVLGSRGLEQRSIFVDTPATWRVLLQHYDVRAADRQRTLLERRVTPRPVLPDASRDEVAEMNQWIEVPPSEGVLDAAIETPLRPHGRLLRTVFRLPKVSLEWEYEDGTRGSCTPLMDTLSNGVAISHVPRDLAQLTALLRGERTLRVKKFRLTGEAATFYGPRVHVTWRPSVAHPLER